MAAKSFTLLNNGNTTVTVTGVTFSTPSGIRHRANLSSFGAGSDVTGASVVCSQSMAAGTSLTFSVDHEYISGATSDTRFGTITISSDVAPVVTINTTIVVGSGGGGDPNEIIVSVVNPLPSQGTYSAIKSGVDNGYSSITLNVRADGGLVIDANSGPGLSSNWLTPYPVAAGSNYSVRFTRGTVSGSGDYSSTNSTGWLSLSQTRSVIVNATGLSDGTLSTVSVPYTVEISQDGGTTIASSGVYTLQATGTLQGIVPVLETVSAFASVSSSAAVYFYPNGQRAMFSYLNLTPVGPWFLNSGGGTPGNNYYIRASKVGADFPTDGPLNTWISMANNVSWSITNNNVPINCSLYIEISTSPSAADIVSTGYINLVTVGIVYGGGGGFLGGGSGGGGVIGLDGTLIPIFGGGKPIIDDFLWKAKFEEFSTGIG